MVTLKNIQKKPTGNYGFLLVKKWGRIPTCTTDEDDVNEVVDCSTLGTLYPTIPFLLGIRFLMILKFRLKIKTSLLEVHHQSLAQTTFGH